VSGENVHTRPSRRPRPRILASVVLQYRGGAVPRPL